MIYVLQGIALDTEYSFFSYTDFQCATSEGRPIITLRAAQEPWEERRVLVVHRYKEISVSRTAEGWLYQSQWDKMQQLYVDSEYRHILVYTPLEYMVEELMEQLLQAILECASIRQGLISLHSACVKLSEGAVCFSANSGVGKSTRGRSWVNAFGADMLSGDRPQIQIMENGALACGVPWDGKEQIYKAESTPLLAICHIRRSKLARVRKLSYEQARELLMQQCFIPMWDTELAFEAMLLVSRLCRQGKVYQVLCGPGENDARKICEILFSHPQEIREVAKEMKIKEGFILRNAMDEHIVMPAGEQLGKFDGAVVLNNVGAFIWEALEQGICREDMLDSIVNEFDVAMEQAEADMDAYLTTLKSYGVLDED